MIKDPKNMKYDVVSLVLTSAAFVALFVWAFHSNSSTPFALLVFATIFVAAAPSALSRGLRTGSLPGFLTQGRASIYLMDLGDTVGWRVVCMTMVSVVSVFAFTREQNWALGIGFGLMAIVEAIGLWLKITRPDAGQKIIAEIGGVKITEEEALKAYSTFPNVRPSTTVPEILEKMKSRFDECADHSADKPKPE